MCVSGVWVEKEQRTAHLSSLMSSSSSISCSVQIIGFFFTLIEKKMKFAFPSFCAHSKSSFIERFLFKEMVGHFTLFFPQDKLSKEMPGRSGPGKRKIKSRK